MIRTVLLLDGSMYVDSSVDFLPSRLLALRPHVAAFARAYLDATPLAELGAVVMRDGIAHRVAALTTSGAAVLAALETQYFLFGGSGALSLENGLRVAASELIDVQRRRVAAAAMRIVIVSCAVTVVDPGDVTALFAALKRLRIRADVLSLTGAPHVLQALAAATGGEMHCALGSDHLRQLVGKLAQLPPRRRRSGGGGGGTKRERLGDDDENVDVDRPIDVGFPLLGPEEGDGTRLLLCPRCGFAQAGVPATCRVCSILVCSAHTAARSLVSANDLVPPTEAVAVADAALRCSHCGAACTASSALRCSACASCRCATCDDFVRGQLGLCPGCVASAP